MSSKKQRRHKRGQGTYKYKKDKTGVPKYECTTCGQDLRICPLCFQPTCLYCGENAVCVFCKTPMSH